jgi:hypothetical protein
MTNLLELADRVEAGEGIVRGLDAEIAATLQFGLPKGCNWAFRFSTWKGVSNGEVLIIGNVNGNGDHISGSFVSPKYTTSLDAALALVPEGCWAEGSLGQHDNTRSSIEIHAPMTYDPIGRAEASTPARALTAACLRARAEMGK